MSYKVNLYFQKAKCKIAKNSHHQKHIAEKKKIKNNLPPPMFINVLYLWSLTTRTEVTSLKGIKQFLILNATFN